MNDSGDQEDQQRATPSSKSMANDSTTKAKGTHHGEPLNLQVSPSNTTSNAEQNTPFNMKLLENHLDEALHSKAAGLDKATRIADEALPNTIENDIHHKVSPESNEEAPSSRLPNFETSSTEIAVQQAEVAPPSIPSTEPTDHNTSNEASTISTPAAMEQTIQAGMHGFHERFNERLNELENKLENKLKKRFNEHFNELENKLENELENEFKKHEKQRKKLCNELNGRIQSHHAKLADIKARVAKVKYLSENAVTSQLRPIYECTGLKGLAFMKGYGSCRHIVCTMPDNPYATTSTSTAPNEASQVHVTLEKDSEHVQFTLFPNLPIELRLKIWHCTFVKRHVSFDFDLAYRFMMRGEGTYKRVNPYIPVALAINQESRQETLKYYEFIFFEEEIYIGMFPDFDIHHIGPGWVNPSLDTIFFSEPSAVLMKYAYDDWFDHIASCIYMGNFRQLEVRHVRWDDIMGGQTEPYYSNTEKLWRLFEHIMAFPGLRTVVLIGHGVAAPTNDQLEIIRKLTVEFLERNKHMFDGCNLPVVKARQHSDLETG